MKLGYIPVKNTKKIFPAKVDDSLILVFVEQRAVILLEGTAFVVWKLINSKRTVKDIISEISENYTGTKNKITEYTTKALNELIKVNAVHLKK